VPGRNGTRVVNDPRLTGTLRPVTVTVAPAGDTLPLTTIEAFVTRVPSSGPES
jgi:hypothetical protein